MTLDNGERLLREMLAWDGNWYLQRYPDIAQGYSAGLLHDPFYHYIDYGRRDGRFPSAAAEAEAERNPDGPGAGVTLGEHWVPFNWPVKGEVSKTFLLNLSNGYFAKYMAGPVILDIGYRGGHEDALPIFPHAIGIDLGYPGYDGVRLPFDDGCVDTVFGSHILEHVPDCRSVIRDWFRVIKVGGFIVCHVPHQFLYEKKLEPPSRWNGDHKRFFTPASLLREFEYSLAVNTYRVRHLADNDLGYVYAIGPEQHAGGCYEIELVIEKIEMPPWMPAP